jgi:hypothetical protein
VGAPAFLGPVFDVGTVSFFKVVVFFVDPILFLFLLMDGVLVGKMVAGYIINKGVENDELLLFGGVVVADVVGSVPEALSLEVVELLSASLVSLWKRISCCDMLDVVMFNENDTLLL